MKKMQLTGFQNYKKLMLQVKMLRQLWQCCYLLKSIGNETATLEMSNLSDATEGLSIDAHYRDLLNFKILLSPLKL